jgi:hypothetical protein
MHSGGTASAAILTIRSGATLTLNAATLELNCLDLMIENGGSLDLAGGTVERCGHLITLNGGQLIGDPASVHYCTDSDNDGLFDYVEQGGCTDPNDADTDNDGILDGQEDANHNGAIDGGETNPCLVDTDGDGLQDGTELGYTMDHIGPDTDTTVFQPDLDPSTKTYPWDADTDRDGKSDGEEDSNHNGRVDPGESDPNVGNPGNLQGIYFILLGDFQ